MAMSDLDVVKDIPGYKIILKAVVKKQIKQLVCVRVSLLIFSQELCFTEALNHARRRVLHLLCILLTLIKNLKKRILVE